MESIAPATLDDIPQLVELLGILYTEESDFEPDAEKQARGLRLIVESPEVGVIFAARDGDQVIGMVNLLSTISTAEGGPACWLEDMVVRPDRRGDGLGSRTLQHAIDFARAQGYTRISLLTDLTNHAAIRFYARHGFTQSGMTPLRLALR